jgi:hypothetical protein
VDTHIEPVSFCYNCPQANDLTLKYADFERADRAKTLSRRLEQTSPQRVKTGIAETELVGFNVSPMLRQHGIAPRSVRKDTVKVIIVSSRILVVNHQFFE